MGPPDALILCGGLGTRLRGALPGTPKCLAPVGGRPFLELLLSQLERAHWSRVILCSGAGADAVRAYGASRHGKLEIVYSEEAEPQGTGGALALAVPWLCTDEVLVMNGDSMVPGLDLAAFVHAHQNRRLPAAMVVVPRAGRSDTGTIALDVHDGVVAFQEKPATAGPLRLDNAGIYLFSKPLLTAIPTGVASSLEREWLPRWVEDGIFAFRHNGPLLDIGTPERWAQAETILQQEGLLD